MHALILCFSGQAKHDTQPKDVFVIKKYLSMVHPPGKAEPLSARRSENLNGDIEVPGDKSTSHRALILGASARGTTHIKGLLEGDDVLSTADAMRALGARVEKKGDMWVVNGLGVGGLLEPENVIDFGNAGTGVRLTMGLVAAYNFSTSFTGDASLRNRPMDRVLAPLRDVGIEATARSNNRLPLTMKGPDKPLPIDTTLKVASAQVKSCLLLAGLNTPGLTRIVEPVPTRDHTENMLKAFGADISVTLNDKGHRIIELQGKADLVGQDIDVPGDPSSSAFALVAGLIVPGSDITVRNIMLNPTRIGLITTLREMGGNIELMNERVSGGEKVGDVRVRASKLKGVDVPCDRAPFMIDEYPILAIAASVAEGTTTMLGIGELRIKESDRLATMAAGLKANGVIHEAGEDRLKVTGAASVPGNGMVQTHLDHRIAMSFLILGLVADNPVTVDDGRVIATSFPNFLSLMAGLGAHMSAT